MTKENLSPSFEELAEESTFTLDKLKKIYLFIYNLWQFIGFLYIVTTLTIRYMKDGEGNGYFTTICLSTNFYVIIV